MTRYRTAATVLLAFAAAIAPAIAAATSAARPDYPLEVGNWWLYRGLVHTGPVTLYDDCGEAQVHSRNGGPITCEFEVRIEVTHVRPLPDGARLISLQSAAAPAGECPYPAAIFDDRFAPRQSCACLTTPDGHYRIAPDLAADLRDPEGPSPDALARARRALKQVGPSFVFPLHDGQRFGGEDGALRTDGAYQWLVRRGEPETIAGRPHADAFVLTHSSLPGDLTVHFVPGLGVSRRAYRHHGSTDEWDLRLTDCRLR